TPTATYSTMMRMKVSHTPLLAVAASSTRMYWLTIHGCRPTSVTTQPASRATIAIAPDAAAGTRNHFVCGKLRLNNHAPAYHNDSRNSSVAKPTIRSQARCTVLTSAIVGRSFSGNESSPWITVDFPVDGSESHDANPGSLMPP